MKVYGPKGGEYEGKSYTGEPVDCREMMTLHGFTLYAPGEAAPLTAEQQEAADKLAAAAKQKIEDDAAFAAKAEADRKEEEQHKSDEKKAADDKLLAEKEAAKALKEAKIAAKAEAEALTVNALMEKLTEAKIDFASDTRKPELVDLYVSVLLAAAKK